MINKRKVKSKKIIVPETEHRKEYWYISKCRDCDLPIKVKVGDMLSVMVKADAMTTLWNAHKITDIESDGTIRIECINKCPNIECTYLSQTQFEIEKIKVDNSIKESKRLGGISI